MYSYCSLSLSVAEVSQCARGVADTCPTQHPTDGRLDAPAVCSVSRRRQRHARLWHAHTLAARGNRLPHGGHAFLSCPIRSQLRGKLWPHVLGGRWGPVGAFSGSRAKQSPWLRRRPPGEEGRSSFQSCSFQQGLGGKHRQPKMAVTPWDLMASC